MLQAKMMKAKRILEIGTLAGYSTIWWVEHWKIEGLLLIIKQQKGLVKL